MNDDRTPRAIPSPDDLLPLAGGSFDARLPLVLLEAVKAIDTPATDFEAELVHELRNKRLGLSDTVAQQIKRYGVAVKAGQRIAYDEVLALARLIGRRPDADVAFREAGRRWARSAVESQRGMRLTMARTLPSLLARPLGLGLLRRVVRRSMNGSLVRQGSTLLLEVEAPVSADATPRGIGCVLYEFAFREALHQVADADGAVEHVMCRSRGDARCQWRSDWRRR
jgi:predicted hydrocarbon binding protein